MTPAARWAAAAEIIDLIVAGEPAEKALTGWARRSRFAGSKDRAAIRDHVFDILRCWRSTAALGGGSSGRARVLGRLHQTGQDPSAVFFEDRFALSPLTDAELSAGHEPSVTEKLDMQDWVFELLSKDHGDEAAAICKSMRHRADVFLRVNLLKSNRDDVRGSLAAQGILTEPHALSPTALRIIEGARKLRGAQAYLDGLVELQDAASQAVVDFLPLSAGMRVLDYCAGGGGKSLAMAALLNGPVDAHDANPQRLRDLPARADRAGAGINIVQEPLGGYDIVLCDVPCSGSGSWRRSPKGKWSLSENRLRDLNKVQQDILNTAKNLVCESGVLAYATCSVLACENAGVIQAFLAANSGWQQTSSRHFLPSDGGDGFFVSTLTRK